MINNLNELAKVVSADVLHNQFAKDKRYPIDHELVIDFNKLPLNKNGELAREDPEEFSRLLNMYTEVKIKYLYDEGFVRMDKGYYVVMSEKDIEDSIKAIGE
jgi:hypothetical protein